MRPESLPRPTMQSSHIPWHFQNSRTSFPFPPFPGLKVWVMPLWLFQSPTFSFSTVVLPTHQPRDTPTPGEDPG